MLNYYLVLRAKNLKIPSSCSSNSQLAQTFSIQQPIDIDGRRLLPPLQAIEDGNSMKSPKRNPEKRAHVHCYNTGLNFKSKDLCPYSAREKRHNWLQGWSEGRQDNRDDLAGISAVQKQVG